MRSRFIAVLALIAALAVSGVAYGSTTAQRTVAPTKITITLHDYSFTFSKAWVKKGTTVVFSIHNAGTVQHNVDFVGIKRTALLSPGAKTTLKIIFKKKGTFQVVCDVPRHIQLGMQTTFSVK